MQPRSNREQTSEVIVSLDGSVQREQRGSEVHVYPYSRAHSITVLSYTMQPRSNHGRFSAATVNSSQTEQILQPMVPVFVHNVYILDAHSASMR